MNYAESNAADHLSPYVDPCRSRFSIECTSPSVKPRSTASPGMSGVRQTDTAVCTSAEGVASTSMSVATIARTWKHAWSTGHVIPGPPTWKQETSHSSHYLDVAHQAAHMYLRRAPTLGPEGSRWRARVPRKMTAPSRTRSYASSPMSCSTFRSR